MADLVEHPECAELIDALAPLASKVRVEPAHWIALPSGDSYETNNGSEWCRDCARFMLRHLRRRDPRHRKEYILDGGWVSEHDTPPHCCQCGVRLEASLLTTGALYELDHFRKHPPEPDEAYEISEMLSAFEVTDAENARFAREAIAIARKMIEGGPANG